MKNRIIASAGLIFILSVGMSYASDAAPRRGCHRHGWYGPEVRVCVPAPVVVPVVVGGYYRPHRHCAPRYYANNYYGGHRHYGRRYCR